LSEDKCHPNILTCPNAYCGYFMKCVEKTKAALMLKWSDGGGTGLVDWTGDLGPGLQVDHTKVAK
jgi:hypothetical protein